MKIALITDLHFGYRNDKMYFDHFNTFYDRVFFPYLNKHNISQVVCLGDTFDNRRALTLETMDHFNAWLSKFRNTCVDFIIGNHDIRYKNTNKLNSPSLLIEDGNLRFTVFDSPRECLYDGVQVLYLPWITEENYEQTMKLIKETKATIVFGHLEINGFDMYSGVLSEGGLDRKIFKKFKQVYSGHYHKKSTQGNITYLGTCYQLYWSDVNEVKGFHVFDTETLEVEFVPNPHDIFIELDYKDLKNIEEDGIKNKNVRVFITDEVDHKKLGKSVEYIGKYAMNVDVVQHVQVNSIEEPQYDLSITGVVEMIDQYVNVMETAEDKNKIKKILGELYIASVRIES